MKNTFSTRGKSPPCTGDSGEDRSRPCLKNTLATFYGETNHFQEPHRLLQVTKMIQKRQRLAPQTILTYLACLKKFVDYLAIRDNIDAARIQAAMNEVKSIYTTSAACDSRRKADERFKLVPSHNIFVARHEQVRKLLQENVEEESLSLKEEKALNYFLLQARLNCRNQPIMNLTWEMLEEIQRSGSVLMSRHKTGQYYDVALRVEPDQIPCTTWKRRTDESSRQFRYSSFLLRRVQRIEVWLARSPKSSQRSSAIEPLTSASTPTQWESTGREECSSWGRMRKSLLMSWPSICTRLDIHSKQLRNITCQPTEIDCWITSSTIFARSPKKTRCQNQ